MAKEKLKPANRPNSGSSFVVSSFVTMQDLPSLGLTQTAEVFIAHIRSLIQYCCLESFTH
jgi:hypothetical protein